MVAVDDQHASLEPLPFNGPCSGRHHLRWRQRYFNHELAAASMSVTAGAETTAVKFDQSTCQREADALHNAAKFTGI